MVKTRLESFVVFLSVAPALVHAELPKEAPEYYSSLESPERNLWVAPSPESEQPRFGLTWLFDQQAIRPRRHPEDWGTGDRYPEDWGTDDSDDSDNENEASFIFSSNYSSSEHVEQRHDFDVHDGLDSDMLDLILLERTGRISNILYRLLLSFRILLCSRRCRSRLRNSTTPLRHVFGRSTAPFLRGAARTPSTPPSITDEEPVISWGQHQLENVVEVEGEIVPDESVMPDVWLWGTLDWENTRENDRCHNNPRVRRSKDEAPGVRIYHHDPRYIYPDRRLVKQDIKLDFNRGVSVVRTTTLP